MTIPSPQAWYAYCVVPASTAAPAAEGILPGSHLEAVPADGVTVLACRRTTLSTPPLPPPVPACRWHLALCSPAWTCSGTGSRHESPPSTQR
jgi:hypothetical protein